MNQDNYIEEKKNSRKDTVKNFLFAFIAGTYLIDNLTKWANDVSLQLTGQETSFGSLFWGDLLSLNLVKIVLTTLVIGFIVAVYAYLSRDRRFSTYLILGLSLIFFAPLLLIIVATVMAIIYGTPINWSDLAIFSGVQVDFYITLFVIQVVLAVVSIKFGQKIGLGQEYLDEKDEVKNSIYGIRKFYWFLIIFPFNMLTYLAIVAVTRVLRGTIQQLIGGMYSGGFEGIVSAIFFPIMAVGIVFLIISKGVEVIRNENLTRINKVIKIIALYVVVPVALFLFIRP
jgi:hypothetical protein